MPEFEGKKFQNVAKEGLKLEEGTKSEEAFKAMEKKFEPLTGWLKEKGLKDLVCLHLCRIFLQKKIDRFFVI